MNQLAKITFGTSILFYRIRHRISPQKRIHLLGDSLMADQPWYKYPRTGWGGQLAAYLNSDKVSVVNHAKNGASTQTFAWEPPLSTIRPNEIAIVGFAHNDIGNTPVSTFSEILTSRVKELKNKGATVLLGTPIAKHLFADDVFRDELSEYSMAVKTVAQEQDVPLLDLHQYSVKLISEMGKAQSAELYLILPPGKFTMHPQGVHDVIHLSVYGAQVFAKYASETINRLL